MTKGDATMRTVDKIAGIIKVVNQIFYILGGISLLALFALMTSDVLGRFLFNAPVKGATEFGEYLIVAVAFMGLAYCQYTKKNVCVDTLSVHFPKKLRHYVIIVGLLLSAVLFTIMAWETGKVAYQDFVDKAVMSRTLVLLPIWIISFIASLGCVLLVITLVLQIIQKLSSATEVKE
jgi:TRAP-type transport system small permease protein